MIRLRRGRASKSPSFLELLQDVAEKAKKAEKLSLGQIFDALAGKGYPTLLVIFGFPFCFPVQVPGISFIFGLALGLMGIRVAFAKHLLWPRWILEKQLSGAHVETLIAKTVKFVVVLQKVLHPRLVFLTRTPLMHRLHGILVFLLGILLALPLPIPFTNILCGFPIVFIGLALLEDDGLFIIAAYLIALVCFAVFTALFFYGKEGAAKFFG